MVSGTVWKRWGLSPSGTLEAETVRGPLIVWASPKPGEKEDAPALEAPKPTPLDLRVWAVNTAAHFEKFRKAARGRVRASVRWKTRRQKVTRAYIAFVKGFTGFSPSGWPAVMRSYRLALARHRREAARKLPKDGVSYRFSEAWLTLDGQKRECLKDSPAQYFRLISKYFHDVSRLPTYYKSGREDWEMLPDESFLDEYFDEDGEEIALISDSDWDKRAQLHSPYQAFTEYAFFPPKKWGEGVNNWLNVSLLDSKERGDLLRAMKRPGFFALLLRALQSAAYLAHARRKVRPAPRRGRMPRPVHTRPRPPSAPLAPPVA